MFSVQGYGQERRLKPEPLLRLISRKVLWTHKKRMTLKGPVGYRFPFRLTDQQGGGGVLVWTGRITWSFEDEFKNNAKSYWHFFFKSVMEQVCFFSESSDFFAGLIFPVWSKWLRERGKDNNRRLRKLHIQTLWNK